MKIIELLFEEMKCPPVLAHRFASRRLPCARSYRRRTWHEAALIPSAPGDDQDHADRSHVGSALALAAAPKAPDRAALPRPSALPRGRALAGPHRLALARSPIRVDELAHRLAPLATLGRRRGLGPCHRGAA